MEWLSSVTGLLTVFGAVVGAFYLYRNVAATDSRAQLDAKDGALVTQKQVIQANEIRLSQLEAAVEKLDRENSDLRSKIEILELYSAPEAIDRFEEQQEIMVEILRGIQHELSRD